MNVFENKRISSGLKRSEAANHLGISYMYIYYIEKGKRKPSKPVIKNMCELYNCKLEELFFAS